MTEAATTGRGWRRGVAAATLAILVGIGLGRFAYSPLIPLLVEAGWLTPAGAAYLGAANLAGYLLGALAARRAARAVPLPGLLRGAMLVAAGSFLASLWPWPPWLFAWRLAAGVAGGTLMVLAAPAVLPFAPPARRGTAAGLVFAGVGLGIVLSGTLVPALAAAGPRTAWAALGLLCLLATAAAWRLWPAGPAEAPPAAAPLAAADRRALGAVFAAYGLVAVGLVPHMVFLVDYVARGLAAGLAAGGLHWTVFGLGALAGPVLAGRLADAVGSAAAFRTVLAAEVACIALPALAPAPPLLLFSSLAVGGAVSGAVPLALGRVQAIVADPAARRVAWSSATVAFALGQAAAGYAFSALFATTGAYAPLFLLGAAVTALAAAISLRA